MCDSHGGGRLVASLYSAVLAEADVEVLVNKRLVGVVVVRQQRLLELALVLEDSLDKKDVGSEHPNVQKKPAGVYLQHIIRQPLFSLFDIKFD